MSTQIESGPVGVESSPEKSPYESSPSQKSPSSASEKTRDSAKRPSSRESTGTGASRPTRTGSASTPKKKKSVKFDENTKAPHNPSPKKRGDIQNLKKQYEDSQKVRTKL